MTERTEGKIEVQQLASRARLRAYVVLAITLVGILVCFLLTVPFLAALTWALALAILYLPAHRWVEGKVKNSSIAATISVLWIGLIVVVPITLLVSLLITEAAKGAATIKEKLESGEWHRAIEGHEALAALTRWINGTDVPGAVSNVAGWMASTTASLVRGWVLMLVTGLLSFYLLFYFLRDRKVALDWLRQVSPLSDLEMNRLFNRIAETIQGTLYGTVVVAVVQGILGGLIFWWLGLPSPLLWGLVMGVLAIIPVLGAFVVWLPVAVYLALDGNWGQALILAGWGAVVIGGIDNLLHPILVGDRLKLHTVPAFVAIVGGLIVFGPSGLLLGPLTVTITVFFLEIWRVRVASEPKI